MYAYMSQIRVLVSCTRRTAGVTSQVDHTHHIPEILALFRLGACRGLIQLPIGPIGIEAPRSHVMILIFLFVGSQNIDPEDNLFPLN